jgi:hypothetical protein
MDAKSVRELRFACEIRTMLAVSYGQRLWMQWPCVVGDIADVYPKVWAVVRQLERQNPGVFRGVFRRFSTAEYRVPRPILNVLLQLGRQEITEDVAMADIRRFVAKNGI